MTESFLKSACSLHAKQNNTGCQHGNIAEAWEVIFYWEETTSSRGAVGPKISIDWGCQQNRFICTSNRYNNMKMLKEIKGKPEYVFNHEIHYSEANQKEKKSGLIRL